jgi:hypothetical protein
MFKEEEHFIPLEEKAAPVAAKNTKAYSYNLLSFDFPQDKQTIRFATREHEGAHRFSLSALPVEARKQFLVDGVPARYVYSRFEGLDGLPVEIDLRKHLSVARAYYTHNLNKALRKHAQVLVPNFLYDTICWFAAKNNGSGKYRAYKKFSLRVQFGPENNTPGLLISFDGYAHTTAVDLSELSKIRGYNENMVRHAVFRGSCYAIKKCPTAARYHPEEVYPILNRELRSLLNIDIPVRPNKEKHLQFQREIKWFYNQFAVREDFKEAIPHQNHFREVEPKDMLAISTNDDLLEFGEGNTGRDIYKGFRDHGPVRLPSCKDVGYFYIYARHQADEKEKCDDALRGGHSGISISGLSRVPMTHEISLDIVFDAKDQPLQTILNKIQLLETEAGRCYFAFLINPWSKYEPDTKYRTIYYRVKEALLLRNIMMQNMDAAKLKRNGLNYFIPNLAAAFTGKLGGIPWRLKRPHTRELIVGFGVFRSMNYNLKYTGSSVCFSNDGAFEAFDCFRAEDTDVLAATVKKALYKYVEAHDKPGRLVIHFYRKLSWKALKPVEDMLRELKLNIPVIIVSINKNYSKNITAFMHNDPYGLPEAGTVINFSPGQYLLYLNDRQPDQKEHQGPMPMPLKMSLWSNDDAVLDNRATLLTLMQQVYDFCFLYYRSVKHARLPVTIVYPELLAGLMPYFRDEVLQEEREGRMMFL